MKHFTISQAAAACRGRMSCADYEDRELGRVVIDSRQVQPGDLFVAYRGEKANGHDYIPCLLSFRRTEGHLRPT